MLVGAIVLFSTELCKKKRVSVLRQLVVDPSQGHSQSITLLDDDASGPLGVLGALGGVGRSDQQSPGPARAQGRAGTGVCHPMTTTLSESGSREPLGEFQDRIQGRTCLVLQYRWRRDRGVLARCGHDVMVFVFCCRDCVTDHRPQIQNTKYGRHWILLSETLQVSFLPLLRSAFSHCYTCIADGACWQPLLPLEAGQVWTRQQQRGSAHKFTSRGGVCPAISACRRRDHQRPVTWRRGPANHRRRPGPAADANGMWLALLSLFDVEGFPPSWAMLLSSSVAVSARRRRRAKSKKPHFYLVFLWPAGPRLVQEFPLIYPASPS